MLRPAKSAWIAFAAILAWLILQASVSPASASHAFRVLFISSYHPAFPTIDQQIEGLHAVFDPQNILFDIEFMDSKRFYTEENFGNFARTLAYKLDHLPPYDLVITGDDNALTFALQHQDDLFAGLPIVFFGIDNLDLALQQDQNPRVTGVVEAVSMQETIDLMLRLTPNASAIYAIVDSTPSGQGNLKKFAALSGLYPDVPFKVLDLTTLSYDELDRELRRLDRTTPVLLLAAYRDRTGRSMDFNEYLPFITARLDAPLYHLWYHGLGQGILGGKVISFYDQSRTVAEIAVRVLNGEPIRSIPVVQESPNRYVFDYQQLQRFGIPLNSLPPNSTILNRPVSVYEQYRPLIWFVITIILLLGVFSVLLSAKIMAQRRAEAALRQRNRELSLLNRVIAASAAEVETEALLATVCRKLAETFRLPQVAAAMLNEEKSQAVVVAEYLAEGRPSGLHAIIPVSGNPSFEYLMTRKKPLVIADAQHDPLLAPVHDLMRQRGTVSLLLLPLLVEGEVVGSIGLDATEPRPFSPEEIELAQRVAEAASGALARTRLTETHRLLTQAIDQSVDTIVITDTEGHITYVNPAFERTTGYTRQEALGENLIDLLKSGAHDREFYRHIADTLRRGQTWQGRVVNRKKDGTRYTDDVNVSPVFNERGEITHYISIQRDISRLIELEEQFHQAQKMEAIGQLTAGIAHDFNNLLTTINGFAELLRFQLAPTDPGVEMVDKIIQAGEQAARLISQLLAFSRKQVIRPRPVNLNQVILGMQGLLHSTLGRPDISLKIHLADDLWPIKADPTQLEQVILNLASNARDALPNGGSVTITTQNIVVDNHLNGHTIKMLPGQYVCLQVQDDGIGMPEAVKAHIFEPFFTTKEVGKGTGLGLASVYGIIRQAGGYIEVETAEGQGSTFTVYWPVIERAVQPAARPEREAGRETILLVEDDASVRGLIKRYLEEEGYHLLIASNGTEALRLAQQYSSPIHLLLTDVVMPEVSGLALADRLIAMYPGMKVVFISGYPREEVLAPGRWRGTYEFLSKPVSPSTLSRRVRAILDGQRPAQPSPDGLNEKAAGQG